MRTILFRTLVTIVVALMAVKAFATEIPIPDPGRMG